MKMEVGFLFRILERQFKCFKIIKKNYIKKIKQDFSLEYLKDSLNVLKL